MAILDHPLVVPVGVSLSLILAVSQLSKIGSRDRQLPLGPPTIPLLGNLLVLPVKDTYLRFEEWAKIYGEVFSLKVGSKTLIVISSLEAADEILEKNGGITADRPEFEPVRKIVGATRMVSFAHSGPQWKKMRRAATEVFKPAARKENLPTQMAEISQLLFDTQENPQNVFYHIQRSTLSTMLSIVAGMRIPQVDSALRKGFFHLWGMVNEAIAPGNAPPVDAIPILNYIPDVFVRNWKARCAASEKMFADIVQAVATTVTTRIKEGQNVGCHLETMIQNAEEWDLDLEAILGTTRGLVVPGTVTSNAVQHYIVLLAAAFPEAQRKVQEELDRVVGSERSPTIDDIPHLPMVNAFVKELHRFRTVAPLGIPHCAQEDQWYKGQLIPKGSTIVFNTWAAFHNPEYYDNPNSFDPERFVRSPYGTKPGLEKTMSIEVLKRVETLQFGFGRRRCAGLPMAVDTAALVAANLLWAFEFGSVVDDDGKEIKPDLDAYTAGFVNDPLPFKCKITTRSASHAEVIKQNYTQSISTFERFENEISKEDREYVDTVRARQVS